VRIAVGVDEGQAPLDSLDCFACKGPTSQVDTRANSLIWYCQTCDVFHETTVTGVKLRSFRKEKGQIIMLPGEDDGPVY